MNDIALTDIGRIAGDVLICVGCAIHFFGVVSYYNARTDSPFRARMVAVMVFLSGAFLLTGWEIFEIVLGVGSFGALVRIVAGVVTIGTGVVASRKRHLDYFKRMVTPEQCSEHMMQINKLMAELREVKHG